MSWAKEKGKSFLNDKCPTVLMRSGDSPGCATCGVNVSPSGRVCVFTKCTQSGSNTFHYLPTGVLKEVSGSAERTRQSRTSNYQLCYLNMSFVPSETQFPHL